MYNQLIRRLDHTEVKYIVKFRQLTLHSAVCTLLSHPIPILLNITLTDENNRLLSKDGPDERVVIDLTVPIYELLPPVIKERPSMNEKRGQRR
jgi:hypothetical protein